MFASGSLPAPPTEDCMARTKSKQKIRKLRAKQRAKRRKKTQAAAKRASA